MAFHASMPLCVFTFVFVGFLLHNVFLKPTDLFVFFVFFVFTKPTETHQKSFYCHGKYFARENFRAPAWIWAKFYCGNKTGNPERAVSLHLACSGGQSQRGIRFILPAHGASHTIIAVSINLLVVYRECVNLIGNITRRLSADSQQL